MSWFGVGFFLRNLGFLILDFLTCIVHLQFTDCIEKKQLVHLTDLTTKTMTYFFM